MSRLIAAWVTWPDGHRELVVDTINALDKLHREGCDIEVEDHA